MLKIGDFSKLSQVSVKSLHFYDRLGLLQPIFVDSFSGYRYYCASQLPRLNRILALKDLGFSLEQISKLLDDQIPPAQIRGMLRLKQAELQQMVEVQQARLERVEARLRQIEQEDKMPEYDVIVKKVEPMRVVSIREVLRDYFAVQPLFDELFGYLQGCKAKRSYCVSIWYDPEYKEQEVDGEAAVSVESLVLGNERLKVYELPAVETMACVIHYGSYNQLSFAYTAILNWIDVNNYQDCGPYRELYIQAGPELDNESYVTEVQFPVEKVC